MCSLAFEKCILPLTERFLGPLFHDEVSILVRGVLGRQVEAIRGGEAKLSDDCAVRSCKNRRLLCNQRVGS